MSIRKRKRESSLEGDEIKLSQEGTKPVKKLKPAESSSLSIQPFNQFISSNLAPFLNRDVVSIIQSYLLQINLLLQKQWNTIELDNPENESLNYMSFIGDEVFVYGIEKVLQVFHYPTGRALRSFDCSKWNKHSEFLCAGQDELFITCTKSKIYDSNWMSVLDSNTFEFKRSFFSFDAAVEAILWNDQLCITPVFSSRMSILSRHDGKSIRSLKPFNQEEYSDATFVDQQRNEIYLASTRPRLIQVMNLETGEHVRYFRHHRSELSFKSVVVFGSQVIAGGSQFIIWDWDHPQEPCRILKDGFLANAMAMSPKNELLVCHKDKINVYL